MPGRILAAWRHGSVEVLLCKHILDKLWRVLHRLKQRHGLSLTEIKDLVDILAIQADLVESLSAAEPALRDEADQPVLGALLAARKGNGADYLITGDKDLLVLADRYPIVTPAEFCEARARF